jgi:hypothetical protein
MSITFSQMRMTAIGCLSATALFGMVNVPTASADYGQGGYGHGDSHAQKDSDYRDREYREPRICKELRTKIEDARQDGESRKVKWLERQYADNDCNRSGYSHR